MDYDNITKNFTEISNDPLFRPLDISKKSDFSERKTTEKPTPSGLPEETTKKENKKLFNSATINDKEVQVLDRDWARQAFLVNDIDLSDNKYDVINRYWSSASRKFVDTRMGGNIGINSRPQFTRYSDIRVKGRIPGRADVSIGNTTGNFGMGRYYSEAIDDNSQTIYLRFGVPQFSSLMSFFSRAFDKDAVSLARSGTGASTFYKLGQAAGTIAAIVAFPVLSSVIIGGRFLSYFFTRPTSKFYTLKPAMHLYWSSVQTLVNTIAINKGLIPRTDSEVVNAISGANYDNVKQTIGSPYKLDSAYLNMLHDAMPDLFTENYGIDVFAIASKAQRIANKLNTADYDTFNKNTPFDFRGVVQHAGQDKIKPELINGSHTWVNWINEVLSLNYYLSDEGTDDGESRLAMDPRYSASGNQYGQPVYDDKGNVTSTEPKNPNEDSFIKYFDAEFRMGSGFAVFKVDHTGAISEGFANSTVESDLSQKFNQTSSQIREAKFSLSEGNITGSAVEDGVKAVAGAAVDVATGALDGMTFGLASIFATAGSGYIDIPKHWQSSSANLPRSSYTMQLISPYGNVISQLQNIFIPLSMLLAGALPISTGKQSYTSPFICQLWDRGRQQIQLGMIESLSITRGTCNLPFTNKGSVMAIDVNFTVADLSSIMHMPISTGGLFGISSKTGNPIMDEDNILFDYLAVLAGQDMYSQIYAIPKARLNFAKGIAAIDKLTSPAYWASYIHDSATSGWLQTVTLGSGNLLEGLVFGSNVATNAQS